MRAAYVAAMAALVMSPAFAQTTAPAQTPGAAPQATTAPAPADDPNEVICRAGEPVIGSRFPGPRQCRTRKEWDRIKQESQEALFHQQMQRSCNAGTNC